MRTLSIRDFKSLISWVIKEKEEVIVTMRGKPVGVFRPIGEEELEQERLRIGMALVGLGESEGGRASEDHDEVVYER